MTSLAPRLQGIRGATTVDRNDAAEILQATDELLRALIEANGLSPDDIVSGLFTVTRDLDATFPARAAEEFGWNIVALLHATEIPVPGSLPKCIRLLVHAYTPRPRAEIKHCYLRGATVLRPDRA
jgi:chorismate mutase